MRFLVDNALSPQFAEALRRAGFDAAHVRDYGLQKSSDVDIFDRALSEDRVVVSADTDFGALLSSYGGKRPSVVLFRRGIERQPEKQTSVFLANFPLFESDLSRGSIVVIEQTRIRIKRLPLE